VISCPRSDFIVARLRIHAGLQADSLAQEEEEAGAAPDGFQSYSAEGYRVLVPAPFSVEGRDNEGVLLVTEDVTGITTKVYAANAIAINGQLSEVEFQELARRFWEPHGTIACGKAKTGVAGHLCTVHSALYGIEEFNGRARFVEGEHRIVPVVCFSIPLKGKDLDYSNHPRSKEEWADLQAEGKRSVERNEAWYASNQLCDTVLDSIRLKEEYGRPLATLRTQGEKAPAMHRTEVAGHGTSLGDVARQAKKEAAQKEKAHVTVEAEDTINAAPPGFRVHTSTHCGNVCWQESFYLPEKARQVKGGNSENVYVTMLDGDTSVVIYFGQTNVTNGYSEYGMAQGVAQGWVHARIDATAKAIHLTRTVNGHEAAATRTRLTANMKVWTEEDVTVAGDDINFSIGCIVREDRFADAESLCSTAWESWRIHR